MAFTNKAEKGALQRGKTGTASMVNKAEKGAVQNGYTAAEVTYVPRHGFIIHNDPGLV